MHLSQKINTSNLFEKSLLQAKVVLNEYEICEYCIGRLFSKKLGLTSNKLLGKKIKNQIHLNSSKKCFICKGILSNLESIVSRMIQKSADYKFSSFVIGAVLKPSVTDRDDLIRSKFKLKGIDSVKTSITKELSKKFAKKTRKKIDYLNPDLTFTFNFKDDSCEIQTKPIILSGRYVKTNRGFPQKQTPCENCNGKGCVQCNNYGFSQFTSVEGIIAKLLFEKFSGNQIKITWIGGEDKNSLVLGNGRPFFTKLLNPKKRNIRLQKKYKIEGIEIHNLKPISKIPIQKISFRSSIHLSIITEKIISEKSLRNLKLLKNKPVTIFEKPNKKIIKSIYNIKFKKSTSKSFSLWIIVDGGLPIKRFVEGNNVHPNLSEILKNTCKCKEFDFLKVDLHNSR